MQHFSNKVVWISGASSGIGEALAYSFYRHGAFVILSARRTERLEKIRKDLGEKAAVLSLDVTKTEAFSNYHEQARSIFGDIDILINNAGISQRSLVEKTDLQVDRQIMEVNYFGNIGLTKVVLPSMLERRTGRIVVISSVAGKLSTAYRSSYSASKHALHGFYDALRAEVASRQIQIHMICPGYINTEISVHALTEKGKPYGIMDDNQKKGMPADVCADKILRAIDRGKKEYLVGGREIHFVALRRIIPWLYFKVIQGMARKQQL